MKSLLSALWNLSAHSIDNKVAICSVDGALGFLVSTLTYRCQTNSLAIIESGGGILRNVSSLVATREDYRCAHETQMIRFYSDIVALHYVDVVERRCNMMFTRYMTRNHTIV